MKCAHSHILLGLLLVLATVTAAMSRPAAALMMQSRQHGEITMVICSSDGAETITVTLDRDGQPQNPATDHDCQPCPICVPSVEATVDPAVVWTRPLQLASDLRKGLRAKRSAGIEQIGHLARGPPKES